MLSGLVLLWMEYVLLSPVPRKQAQIDKLISTFSPRLDPYERLPKGLLTCCNSALVRYSGIAFVLALEPIEAFFIGG